MHVSAAPDCLCPSARSNAALLFADTDARVSACVHIWFLQRVDFMLGEEPERSVAHLAGSSEPPWLVPGSQADLRCGCKLSNVSSVFAE